MPLSKQAILDVQDLKREEVQIPEWGGSVFVRMMTAGERDRFEAEFQAAKDGMKDLRAKLAQLVVTDAEGIALFTADEVAKLSAKSAAALDRIFTVAIRLNKIGQQDIEDLESKQNV